MNFCFLPGAVAGGVAARGVKDGVALVAGGATGAADAPADAGGVAGTESARARPAASASTVTTVGAVASLTLRRVAGSRSVVETPANLHPDPVERAHHIATTIAAAIATA